MKVRILQCLSGVGFTHNTGDEVEVDDAEADRLIGKGIAEPLGQGKAAKAKTAKKKAVENAAAR